MAELFVGTGYVDRLGGSRKLTRSSSQSGDFFIDFGDKHNPLRILQLTEFQEQSLRTGGFSGAIQFREPYAPLIESQPKKNSWLAKIHAKLFSPPGQLAQPDGTSWLAGVGISLLDE